MHYDISAIVRRFIGENFMFREEVEALPENASLLDAGIIDSTGVLELVCFLESTFSIEIADEEMLPGNLDSVDAISSYVKRKVEPRQAQLAAA
jgi:acyl carrier protein